MSTQALRRIGLAAVMLLVTALGVSGTTAYAAPLTGTVAGHLTDAGAPVANAQVALFDLNVNFVQETVTDSEGAFGFLDVPAEDYKLSFVLFGSLTQFHNQKLSFETADTITVVAGAQTTVDESVIPHGTITGRVTNADGSAVPFPTVTAHTTAFDVFILSGGDQDGNYSFPVVPAGTYNVAFRSGFRNPEQFFNQKTTQATADPVEVAVGQSVTLDQEMLPTGAISGHLTHDGQPVVDASVSVESESGLFGSATTDENGAFRVVLFPGTYTIRFDLVSGLVQYFHQTTRAEEADPVTVIAGPDTTVDEELMDRGTVSGRLVDANGSPVAGTSVSLTNGRDFASGSTDDNGAYEVVAFPGVYRLSFFTPYGLQWAHGRSTAGTGDLITVVANQDTTVDETLASPGSLKVVARDAATGQPFNDFCAFANNLSANPCGEGGTADFGPVLPGRYDITILPNNEGFVFASASGVVVRSGETTTVVVDIVKYGELRTVIRDAKTGAPVEGACIELVPPQRPMSLGTSEAGCSTADGSLTVPRVIPGVYNVFTWARDGVHGHQWVGLSGGTGAQARARLITVGAGKTATMSPIRLDGAGAISGVITDKATGAPVLRAVAGLASLSVGFGSTAAHTFTDAQGRYTISGLGPYSWTLFFAHLQYAAEFSGGKTNRFLASGVGVKEGTTTQHDVGLRKGTLLTGSVTGPNGEPTGLFDARISVFNAITGDGMGAGDTRADGTYQVRVLGPQIVRLQYFANIIGAQYAGFYVDAADLQHATPVLIPASGTKTVNVRATRETP